MTLTATSHLFVASEPCGGRGPGRKHLCTQSDVRSPLVFPLSNALYLSSLPYNSALQPNRRAWKIPWLLERTSYRDFQHEMFGTAQGWEQEHRQAEAPQTTHLAASDIRLPQTQTQLLVFRWSQKKNTLGSNHILIVA